MYKDHFLLFISKLLKLLDPEFVLTCGSGFLYTTRWSSRLEKVSVSGVVLWAQHRWFPEDRDASLPAWSELDARTAVLTDWWAQQPPFRALVSLQHTWLRVGKLDKPRDLLWAMLRCCNSCCCCRHIRGDHPHWSQPNNLLATPLILSSPPSFRPDPSPLMNLEQFANRCFWLH